MSNEYDNKYVHNAVEKLRMTLGELSTEVDPFTIITVADVRIRRLESELAEAKGRAVDADGWSCIRCGKFTDVCPSCAVELGELKGKDNDKLHE